MRNWAITDRITGEHSFTTTEDGKTPADCGYSTKTHRFRELDREPTEHDSFDGNKLVCCEETRKRRTEEARLNTLSRADRHKELVNKVEQVSRAISAQILDQNARLGELEEELRALLSRPRGDA